MNNKDEILMCVYKLVSPHKQGLLGGEKKFEVDI